MDEIEWWEFDTAREMAEQAAGDIGFVIESAIEAHKGARIALPGGSTSDLIFAQLAKSKAIDWSKVTIMPTDDRLVPLGDPLSNYRKLEAFSPRRAPTRLAGRRSRARRPPGGRAGSPTPGWRCSAGRSTSPASAWAPTATPPASSPAPISSAPSPARASAAPSASGPIRCRTTAPVDRVTLTAPALDLGAGDHDRHRRRREARGCWSRRSRRARCPPPPIGRLLAGIESPIDIFWSAEG